MRKLRSGLGISLLSPLLMQEKWNPVAVAFLVIAGVVLVPIILVPAGPFIWVAAVSLGVWKGFLVVQIGTAIGMSLSYALGRWLLRDRIKRSAFEQPKPATNTCMPTCSCSFARHLQQRGEHEPNKVKHNIRLEGFSEHAGICAQQL